MSNIVFDTVDKMPFSGKYSIGSSVKKYLRAGPEQEKKSFRSTAGLLGFMVLGHGVQLHMAYQSFNNHADAMRYSSNTLNSAFQVVDVLYGTANAAVTARQASLLYMVSRKHAQRRSQLTSPRELVEVAPSSTILSEPSISHTETTPPKMVETKENQRTPLQKGLATSIAFTLAGQALFTTSYIEGKTEKAFVECADSLSGQFQQAENNQGISIDDGWEQEYILSVC